MSKQTLRPKIVLILFIAALVLNFSKFAVHSTCLASSASKSWTFIVYLDADNNLESAGLKDLNEMESVGSTANIDIVVQIDRISGYDDSNGDWTGTKRYYVTKDSDWEIIHSTLIQDLGEVNMGSPDTLSSFVTWAIQNYPAEHYALVLWDHGGGYPGVCWDDTSNGDCLTMAELKQALSNVKSATGAKTDVLGFDACLMGMIEVAHQIKDYTSFMVGSEETEPNDGWPYDKILTDLANSPSMSASQLASTITTEYVTSYTDGLLNPEDAPSATQAAYDLTKEPALTIAISEFADVLKDSFSQYKNEIISARRQSELFHGEFIDLYDFTHRIRNSIADTTIQSAADNVMNRVTSFVVAQGHGSEHPNSLGATIYYPDKYDRAAYAGSEAEKTLDFPWDTRWDEFLDFGTNVEADLTPQLPTYTAPGNIALTHVAAGDVDGDNKFEVIGVGNYTDDYGYAYFVVIVCKVTETGLKVQYNDTMSLGAYQELTSLSCADSDDDLKDEIIMTANFYNLTDYEWYACMIVLNVDAGGIHLQAYDESANITLESLDVKDVDADGFNEIVISGHIQDQFGYEYAYIAVGNNSVPDEIALENYYSWSTGTGEDLRVVAVGDTDNDGLAEIVVGGIYYDFTYDSWYGYVSVLNFTDNLFWIQAYDYGQNIWINSLKIADVNGDNMNEIVVSGYSWDMYGAYYFYIGIGANRPSDSIAWLYQDLYSLGEYEELSSVDVADVDGDGISEIIVSGYYYDTSYGEWNAYQGIFSWSTATGMVLENAYYGQSGNDFGYSLTLADLDDDGQMEVVTANTLAGDVYTGQINVQEASNYVPETGSITGVVTDGVNPIPSATVTAAISRYSVLATTTTLGNGSYIIADLPPGSYDIEVYATGKLNETKTSVLVDAGQTTTVSFEMQTVAVAIDHEVTAEGLTFHVITLSNSTVTNLTFNEGQREISFDVTGTSGTRGFCNVTIPKNLLSGDFTVKIDGVEVTPDPTVTVNATHSLVHFAYGQSTREIQVTGTEGIPEFSSVLTFSLLLTLISLAALLTKRNMLKRKN